MSGGEPSGGLFKTELRRGAHFVFLAGLPAFLPYRLLEFDSVSTVHDAVENAVGHSGIADLFVPVRDGHLRGEDQERR